MLTVFNKINLFAFLFLVITSSLTSMADDKVIDEKVMFESDPVYQKLADEDSHPMEEMIELAKQGNVRAQFVLGDLYSKGKGGLGQDLNKARKYFEDSAIHGYNYALVRLAALEKRTKNPLEAWKWYTIAIRNFPQDDLRMYVVKARAELVKENNITELNTKKMNKAVLAWDDKRSEILRKEKIEAYEREKAAEKAKEKAKKDSKKIEVKAEESPKVEETTVEVKEVPKEEIKQEESPKVEEINKETAKEEPKQEVEEEVKKNLEKEVEASPVNAMVVSETDDIKKKEDSLENKEEVKPASESDNTLSSEEKKMDAPNN